MRNGFIQVENIITISFNNIISVFFSVSSQAKFSLSFAVNCPQFAVHLIDPITVCVTYLIPFSRL